MIQSNVYKYLSTLLEWRECFEDEALEEEKELGMSNHKGDGNDLAQFCCEFILPYVHFFSYATDITCIKFFFT